MRLLCLSMELLGALHCDPQPTVRGVQRGRTSLCDARTPADRVISRALGVAVKRAGPLASDRQTCEFESANRMRLFVSVRPGMGRLTIDSWLNGRMPLEAAPFSGVGDRALWQPELGELLAERGDLLCDITVTERNGKRRVPLAANLAERLGVLCNSVFVAAR
ncbi:MAG: hypothetical protein ABJF01_16315 [bacterium]